MTQAERIEALEAQVAALTSEGEAAKGGGASTKRAKTIGRMIAAGVLNANDRPTWRELLEVFDVAENTAHGAARRKELVEAGVLTD